MASSPELRYLEQQQPRQLFAKNDVASPSASSSSLSSFVESCVDDGDNDRSKTDSLNNLCYDVSTEGKACSTNSDVFHSSSQRSGGSQLDEFPVHHCNYNSKTLIEDFSSEHSSCGSFNDYNSDPRVTRTVKDDNFVIAAIFCAVEEENISGLDELFTMSNINPNISNKHGETAVHIAAGLGQLEILKYIQTKGANIHLLDNNGDSAMCWAARQGHSSVINFLVSEDVVVHMHNKAGETALHIASRYGHSEAVQALCAAGSDVNAYDEHGETSLHIAVWHGFAKIVFILCQHGANTNLTDKDEESPLHCAASRGHIESVKCLMDSNAVLDLQDKRGSTPLHLAIKRHHSHVAMILLHAGCHIDVLDNHGESPIHLVAREGLLPLAQTLCAFGCKVDIPNKAGLYPLHLASKNGHIEVVRCLCLAGAVVDQKNKDGIPAEITALAQGFSDIGDLLNKLRNDQQREYYISQLIPSQQPISRIKVKVFGHSGVGKTTLLDSLKCSYISSFFRRTKSGRGSKNAGSNLNLLPKQPQPLPHLSTIELNSSAIMKGKAPLSFDTGYDNYTRGIDVQQASLSGAGGDYSIWEFSGQEPYLFTYDHFIGNTNCVHVIVFKLTDTYQVQLRQVKFWLQFLQARIPPQLPLGHGGKSSKPAKVVLVAAHADGARCTRNATTGEYVSSEAIAIHKFAIDRFGDVFDIHDTVYTLDAHVVGSPTMKAFKYYLCDIKTKVVQWLPKTTGFLDSIISTLPTWRKNYPSFPVSSWQQFIEMVHSQVNPLAGEEHMKELIQQLQLMGEVLYLKSDTQDMVLYNPRWLCNEVVGHLLSHEHLDRARVTGCYSVDDIQLLFPETDALDLLQVLESVCVCTQCDNDGDIEYEFPCFNHVESLPGLWDKHDLRYIDAVYGGVRLQYVPDVNSQLFSLFPRLQVQLRRAALEHHDPENDLYQWFHGSKFCSGSLEGLITLEEKGEAVEVKVRGPKAMASDCYYFLEDLITVVEHVLTDITPGLLTERHVLSSKQLRDHSSKIISFSPQELLASQLSLNNVDQSRNINNNHDEPLLDLVCFGSKNVEEGLTLGRDLHISSLSVLTKQKLSALLDPTDSMGRDWCMLAVRLGMTEKLPRLDTGDNPSVSHTCRIIDEWSKSSNNCTIRCLVEKLEELGRRDAVDIILEAVQVARMDPGADEESEQIAASSTGGGSHTSSSNLSR
ncbi:DAPK1 (predicted) [Pycnogonum litorale]